MEATPGKYPSAFLTVGILHINLVRGDKLVVKVKLEAISGIDLAGGGETLQKQRVHLLVHIEVVKLLLTALIWDAVLGEVQQRPEDNIR